MKALIYADASGKSKEEELTGDLKARAEEARTKLCEAVAETDDALLEKYLDSGELREAELRTALRAAVIAGKITPVLCGSGAKNIGLRRLLDAVVLSCPRPMSGRRRNARSRPTASRSNALDDPAAPFSARRVQDYDRSFRRQALDLSRASRAAH